MGRRELRSGEPPSRRLLGVRRMIGCLQMGGSRFPHEELGRFCGCRSDSEGSDAVPRRVVVSPLSPKREGTQRDSSEHDADMNPSPLSRQRERSSLNETVCLLLCPSLLKENPLSSILEALQVLVTAVSAAAEAHTVKLYRPTSYPVFVMSSSPRQAKEFRVVQMKAVHPQEDLSPYLTLHHQKGVSHKKEDTHNLDKLGRQAREGECWLEGVSRCAFSPLVGELCPVLT